MKKLSILFIAIILSSCGDKNPYPNEISDFRTELQEPLKKLAKEKSLPSHDTIARNFIEDNCTKEELVNIMKCESPILRVVAYKCIVNRNEKDYFEILLGHLSDTTKVEWWYYDDAGGNFMASDLMIRKAEAERKLNRVQKNILIDSVLLKHPYLEVADWMIVEIDPQEKYYSLIKQKAQLKTDDCGQLGRCYALSKFRKKEDLNFLKEQFSKFDYPCDDYIFQSIEDNPNEIYFPILQKYMETVIKKQKQQGSDVLKYYCRAVAAYKNEESLALLNEVLNDKNYPDTWYFKYNVDDVFRAIHKHKAPVYDGLYSKLKPKMSSFVMKYLDKPDYSERKTW